VTVELHLNLSGGLTGDMFIAAVLDAFPRFEQRVIRAIDALDSPYPVVCSLVEHSDYEVTGHRFAIEPFDKYFGHIPLAFPREPSPWESVRDRLVAAEIAQNARAHALKIFEMLVRAEAAVHGILPERVTFEAGAWNSIAQVVGAATLIDALDTARWSVSPYPPSGAVTLTGAAIVDYLCPPRSRGRPQPKARSLVRSGTGFGSRTSSQNNYLRLLCFETGDAAVHDDDARAPRRTEGRAEQQPRQ
jgi:pyridinium-3,5-bisthiocarboxylic acid mononucleotide nickel chelatase